ncbi:MAG: hypothetical protein ABI411_10630 [Tahibacter sp.]
MMVRRLALAAALFASSAWAQQELALTAKDIQSGGADAKLAELGRQAAASGKEVVVNAPKEWHAQVAAKIRAGGKADVKLNDSFFENVVVRVADKSAAKPAEVAKPVEAAKPVAAPPLAAKPVEAPRPAPVAKPVEAPPAPRPAVVAAPPPPPAPVEAPVAAPPPVVQPTPAPVAAPPPRPVAATPAPAVDERAAARKRLEQSLNEGKPAEGEIASAQLEKGDLIYVDGTVRGVVHRERLRSRLFWLSDDLNLQRAELKSLSGNRYEVVDQISASGDVSLRGEAVGGPKMFAAKVPDDGAAERAEMEKAYSEGRSIVRNLRPDQLKNGDLLYIGKTAAVIVRRDGTNLVRYWLDGTMDINQHGLQKDGASKYRVLSDTLK